jgi:hypothetical protein
MILGNAKSLGMHWAALRGKWVVAVIPMTVRKDVDFEEYRRRALWGTRDFAAIDCIKLLSY